MDVEIREKVDAVRYWSPRKYRKQSAAKSRPRTT